MIKSIGKETWLKMLGLATSSLAFLLIENGIIEILDKYEMEQYWMAIPVALFLISIFVSEIYLKKHNKTLNLVISNLISFILLVCFNKTDQAKAWFEFNFEAITIIIFVMFLVNLIVSKYAKKDVSDKLKSKQTKDLFNLFYINTSKAHEIAMLIDNKIMKTVEREQVSEELLKQNASIALGGSAKWSAGVGYSKEDSSKKKVYESFDVKTTKSIMLRKIYETTQNSDKSQHNLETGDLTIFEDIELQQRNVDDTVMILNILQDSNIKNVANDSLEINLNKMMDKMLDDFTIDYSFSYSNHDGINEQYIMQLPYKSTENFENGYQHNDLQLGKLSLIGIYRGKIDFTKRESISSKFLELMSDSYNQEMRKVKDTGVGMKFSNQSPSSSSGDIQIQFQHEKLKGELHLIDVIAIIQQLNFDGDQ